jgi:hypothetical protein
MISWISVVFVLISPFAFLILLIWVFSPHFSQVCQGSVDLVYFFKEPTFCFINSLQVFFCFYFIDFSSYVYYFSPSVCFAVGLLVLVFLGV